VNENASRFLSIILYRPNVVTSSSWPVKAGDVEVDAVFDVHTATSPQSSRSWGLVDLI
jgi:hypothetical protein